MTPTTLPSRVRPASNRAIGDHSEPLRRETKTYNPLQLSFDLPCSLRSESQVSPESQASLINVGKGRTMKRMRAVLLSAVIAAGSLAGTSAWADRGYYRGPGPRYPSHHYHYGGGPWIGLGAGLLFGSALYWATRPPPPTVYVAPEPVVVVQPQASGGEWWYFCRAAGAYYPYVQQCPTGWERVPPYPAD